MTRPAAARGDPLLGRGLLTLANVITVAAPVAADWNDSHIFNSRWPAHARFHGVTALAMTATLSSLNIWSIWSGRGDRTTARPLPGVPGHDGPPRETEGASPQPGAPARHITQTHNRVIGAPPANRLAGTSRAPARQRAGAEIRSRSVAGPG